MDQIEQVKKLREEYERALDAAESRRSAYHEAVLELYRGGTPLREIAKELGLSHQRVHQIVSGESPAGKKLPRAAGGAAVIVLILAAATFGVLRLAHASPFAGAPLQVSIPNVVNEPASVAMRHLTAVGLQARVLYIEHKQALAIPDRVYAQKGPAGEYVARGSLVTLYVATQRHVAIRPSTRFIALRAGGLGGAPGGAVLSKRREVLKRRTPLGLVSLWVAPDRVSRSSRCSWLQIDGMPRGGSCYHQPSRRGIPQTVSPVFTFKSGQKLPLVWGRANASVDRLTLVFRDGERIRIPVRYGLFLYAAAVPESRWRKGHQPASLVAGDRSDRVIDKRLLCWTSDGISYASSVCASRGRP